MIMKTPIEQCAEENYSNPRLKEAISQLTEVAIAPNQSGDKLNTGIWYQAACSGLWYKNPKAAGDIRAVKIEGKFYFQDEPFTQPSKSLEEQVNKCFDALFIDESYYNVTAKDILAAAFLEYAASLEPKPVESLEAPKN